MKIPFHRTAPDPLAADEARFVAGTRSLADLVAPESLTITPRHLDVGGQCVRTLFVSGYPRSVGPGWLSPLIDLGEPLEISIHVTPLASGAAARHLDGQVLALESARRYAERVGRLPDPERETALDDLTTLRDKLQRGDEKVFSVGLYILLRAGDLAALDDLTRRVQAALDGILAHARVATLRQTEGFRTALPQAHDELAEVRNIDTSGLATLFPFTSSALSMERGVLYGVTLRGSSPVLIDPFDAGQLENANLAIFATSGAGKSYFTKLLVLRSLLAGTGAIAIDPEGEYRALARAVGGQRVRLAADSVQHINPFDLPRPYSSTNTDAGDVLTQHVTELVQFVGTLVTQPGEGLGSDALAVLDTGLLRTYARAGITSDPDTHRRPAPLLADLHRELVAAPLPAATLLAGRLERYVHGSLAGIFSSPTNVDLDARLVVFDTADLAEELRPLAIGLIAAYVWTRARTDPKPRLLVIDEAWSLLRYPAGAEFLEHLARRARKHYLGLVTISQDVADFLGDPHGRTVLATSACKLLLKQDSSTLAALCQHYPLSPEERHFLLGAGRGEGLFLARGSRMPIRIEASTAEDRLCTTTPTEVIAREAMPVALEELPELLALNGAIE
jgi:conjugal transfer ATP-binding protein TraC